MSVSGKQLEVDVYFDVAADTDGHKMKQTQCLHSEVPHTMSGATSAEFISQ